MLHCKKFDQLPWTSWCCNQGVFQKIAGVLSGSVLTLDTPNDLVLCSVTAPCVSLGVRPHKPRRTGQHERLPVLLLTCD